MLKNCKNFLLVLIIMFLLHCPSNARAATVDMAKVYSHGLLGSLYGCLLIGTANTLVILMGDNTRSNFYRVKYGFAIGAILGLVYGTAMGMMGNPLIPSFSDGGGAGAVKAPPTTSYNLINKNIYLALSNLKIKEVDGKFSLYTKLLKLSF